ncbi:MAG TPA: TonB-dependent receptor plug domain-containing protein, partial [Hyphomonadaceae bacterium]|nr:TonB-dependent receptor plug domain-containing protein [Hyphomonadaceae bacterium]
MAKVRLTAIRALLLASTALAFSGAAFAQEAAQSQADQAADQAADRVVVVGSQIRGAEVTDALPVTVVTAEEISTVSAASGDELFRSIPQLGDVAFNSSRTVGSVNDARGDTASINLRALGTGNTLVLLNGRRMVNHPGTQAENSVPVVSANTNSIPVLGVERVEVLLDGASAIYGADAVAGVVNTVLRDDFEGFTTELNVGQEEGISGLEISAAMQGGWNLNDGRTNISLFGSYFTRDPIVARDRDFTANADLTSRGGTNGASTTSAWAGLDRFTAGNITINGTAVTNANG